MKITRLLNYAAVTLLFLPAPAFASCANLALLLGKAYPAAKQTEQGLEIGGEPQQVVSPDGVACTTWPASPEFTLIAAPRLELNPKEEGLRHGDIEIIVADTKTGDPIARYVEKAAAFSDAIAFRGVEFDTARVDIKPGRRAFGIRTHYWHDSSAFPFYQSTLWLYTLDGKKIRSVLEGLSVETSRGENDQHCNGYFETTALTVMMGKAGLDGFRDLILDETITTETSKRKDDDCSLTKKSDAGKHYVLHFGDPHYGRFDGKGAFKDAAYEDLFSSILSER
jgi:hypothetical protein